jgi:predicted peroxiredoxin
LIVYSCTSFRRSRISPLLAYRTSAGEEEEFPTLKEMMDQVLEAGVKLMVCEQSTQLLRLKRGDFIKEAEIVGAATLNDLVLDADGTMWF